MPLEVRSEFMEESILVTVKKLLGLTAEYNVFDTDILSYINSSMMTLQQIGVGPITGFIVTGYDETWSDFLPDDRNCEMVKAYIALSVKQMFDPPTSSFVMDSITRKMEEMEWRLREQAEFNPADYSKDSGDE